MNFIRDFFHKIDTIYQQSSALLRILVNLQNAIPPIHKALNNIEGSIEESVENSNRDDSLLTVARHTLGSIDVADIQNPDDDTSPGYIEYCARAAQFYDFFEKEAKHMMRMQHDYWFTQGEGWEQTLFGRGTTNGIQLMLDRFVLLKNRYIEHVKKEKEPPIGSHEDILAKLQVAPSADVETDGVEEK